ncbi:hypothetical protein BJ546DRAFT_838759, partial [Cryomyces antarcticus]
YRSLSSRTRLLIGIGVMGYAGFGMLMTDQAEKVFELTPTEQDKEKLDRILPRITTIEKDDGLR